MSIIERAASRIEHPKDAPAADSAAPAAAPAVQDAGHAAAVAAAMAAAPQEAAPAAAVAAAAPAPAAAPVAAVSAASAPAAAPSGDAAVAEGAPRRGPRRVELDLQHMQDIGLVTAAGGRTTLVEDFRVIKRPLIKRAFGPRPAGEKPGNLIMITSSLPGEGKTFCSINLAMSIAMELDHTVLLVDADVARPSVLRTLGLPVQRGLMDLLLDEKVDMADVMLRTNVDTLTLLPAGTSNPRATELLASQTMTSLVYEIANRYPDRIVIFDSPPLLLTSEAHVLAGHMGQIVVVVEAERTTQHAVKEALSQLEGLNNVNLIYNKTREFPGTETYDYHYG
ncbi:protein tyrosine kinase [Massilia sp. Root351]|jgi:exopolysaccharide/PEP-CTERM locus tyrosine autokinase|uniref:XrtA-associated tyrosine autokinase n=1 Tax=Massilia sp. Root351 TaxID=1736522 RepID=UPI00070A2377|nr:XrtA-associated tyrosine autokinase [Massilia sp. Root351]KQV79046.1 protein tyrosine kinase [Massilia sp. Root351]